jgi:hypothetical protein
VSSSCPNAQRPWHDDSYSSDVPRNYSCHHQEYKAGSMVSFEYRNNTKLRTFPGQSKHFTRHSCSPLGAARVTISNLSSGYLAIIAACAAMIDSGGKSCERHVEFQKYKHQLSRTSALCIGDVGRAEGPGSEGETSSVVGKGMGVFELDFEWPVPFSFIF